MIGDIKQLFSELSYEQKLTYVYGHVSHCELEEEMGWGLDESSFEELKYISEYISDLKRQNNG